jgi:hypothetical protein
VMYDYVSEIFNLHNCSSIVMYFLSIF